MAYDDLQDDLAEYPEQDPGEAQREAEEVEAWLKRYKRGREFDKGAREAYARDRRYARGDTEQDVGANWIGMFIEILQAFLYARDPDVDCLPGRSAEPPSLDAIRDSVSGDPEIEQLAMQSRMAAVQAYMEQGGDPSQAQMVGDGAAAQAKVQFVHQRHQELRNRYQSKARERKAFAETMEIVIARLWKHAGLKRHARRLVNSGLTVGLGWLKAAWIERMERDAIIDQQIGDLKDNIDKLAAMQQDMASEDGRSEADDAAKQADYEAQLQALDAEVEKVVARGFFVGFERAEAITVDPTVELCDYLDAGWIMHETFMPCDEAEATFRLPRRKVKSGTSYYPRKPVMGVERTPHTVEHIDASEADAFVTETGALGPDGDYEADDPHVKVIEVWDRGANRVLTMIEGMKCWARKHWHPKPTMRFYPFFLLAFSYVDGQRHPQSRVQRTYKLQDEYNITRTKFKQHRSRTMPKTAFDAGLVPPEEARKLEGATTQEMVGLKLTRPGTGELSKSIVPIQYAPVDQALYDTNHIMGELERFWGVQEALQGSVTAQKTATEAEIQQTGFNARTGSDRDALEDVLSELAVYTGEVALANMTLDDVQDMAGPDAFWPEGVGAEDLGVMLSIDVRAGSSGKPNTRAQREAWGTILPIAERLIQVIGQLRSAAPEDMADAFEELLRETVSRLGDRIDIERFLPQPGDQPGAMGGMPGAPPGMGAPLAAEDTGGGGPGSGPEAPPNPTGPEAGPPPATNGA